MKKNVMTAIVSGAMVGCLAIGGTFAYLTANSGTVKNTFTGAQALNVTISESTSATEKDTYKVDNAANLEQEGDRLTTGELSNGEKGIDYTKVVPGASIDKDVDVHVKDADTDSYVFIRITGLDDNNLNETAIQTSSVGGVNYEWVKADDLDTLDGLYVLKVVGGDCAKVKNIDLNVFDTINVKTDATVNNDGVIEINNITVTAMIVQANGVDYDTALDQVNI